MPMVHLQQQHQHQHGSPLSSTTSASLLPASGLTFSRSWLVHIAHETVKIAEEGCYTNGQGRKVCVAEALRYSMKNSVHYHSSHQFTQEEIRLHAGPPRFEDTEYHVVYGSSLQVATKLQEYLSSNDTDNTDTDTDDSSGTIGILNSASGKHPEKFLRGTLSQEEGICRATLLYPCLMQYYNRPHHFYYVNHKEKYQDNSSSCAIFVPSVPMVRADSQRGDLLEHPLKFSVISIPAPNAFALGDDTAPCVPKAQSIGASKNNEPYQYWTVERALEDRLHRALSILALQGCTDIVLCAFGCGVHGNSPQQAARSFRTLLHGEFAGRFRTVAFAMNSNRPHNFEQFAQVFQQQPEEQEEPQS
ncbi:Uncharacterized protein conserved in bacteria (DUF2263) [Seminavis robusta]|uniref:Uncharacterized protein conserved in bacteria (DUF2263) n=1 Tax=Seminavis robusta TaxID=568900 RepID=A0A9N8DN88_9STRA|nr:Uncharacterized protein conserved in bacteria (DUF2263) [Seminavis robusta]|eukprot:Sro221_g090920.1 Uncharacterized protein conserved in bacteria (DUF2263) (360) ;mRNA; r:19085-20164